MRPASDDAAHTPTSKKAKRPLLGNHDHSFKGNLRCSLGYPHVAGKATEQACLFAPENRHPQILSRHLMGQVHGAFSRGRHTSVRSWPAAKGEHPCLPAQRNRPPGRTRDLPRVQPRGPPSLPPGFRSPHRQRLQPPPPVGHPATGTVDFDPIRAGEVRTPEEAAILPRPFASEHASMPRKAIERPAVVFLR